MNRKEFIKVENSRATAFNVFTALLCQPGEDLTTQNDIFDVLIGELGALSSEGADFARRMKAEVGNYSSKELLIEYTKLFLGPFKVLAPPYSSIYFGRKQLVSDETIWVANFYQKAGLQFDKELKDLPDHAAVESEFMYYLIFNELIEIESGNLNKCNEFYNYQKDFFNSHYKEWIPKFCIQIVKQSGNSYYKMLAHCLNSFITTVSIPEFNPEK